MYFVNKDTGSLWYKFPYEEELDFVGYEKDYKHVFRTLKISVSNL